MGHTPNCLARFVAFGLATVAVPAAAQQQGSNAVWLGQTGNTNTIVILQEGEGNAAGADNVFLRLNQDGDFNHLSIEQFGWDNRVGAVYRGDARPSGTNQVGDRNSIEIDQHNSEASGFNVVGSVLQTSFRLLLNAANILFIRQWESNGVDLAAGHAVGTVSQTNTVAESAPNIASIWQSGGGGGLGNFVDQVYQNGSGNVLEVFQTAQDNVVEVLQQIGSANYLKTEQGNGEANALGTLQQFGSFNEATIRQSGARNAIGRVLQNNEILAGGGVGNRMEIVVTGEDNGGDGLGGVGEFLDESTLALSGVAQGDLVQMGDDNDMRLTIVQGSLTKFGIVQIGDGNGAVVSISAPGGGTASMNETAVFQDGLDNNLSQVIIGSENAMAASQAGQRNRGELRQEGSLNNLVVVVEGDDNNALSLGGFEAEAGVVASASSLLPGQITQVGLTNAVSLDVEGSRNLFAVAQTGESHTMSGSVLGNGNQTAIVQTGAGNTSLSIQSGATNSLAVRQY